MTLAVGWRAAEHPCVVPTQPLPVSTDSRFKSVEDQIVCDCMNTEISRLAGESAARRVCVDSIGHLTGSRAVSGETSREVGVLSVAFVEVDATLRSFATAARPFDANLRAGNCVDCSRYSSLACYGPCHSGCEKQWSNKSREHSQLRAVGRNDWREARS